MPTSLEFAQVVASLMTPFALLTAVTIGLLYVRRQIKADEFNRDIALRELRLREQDQSTTEMRDLLARMREPAAEPAKGPESNSGYVFFDIKDEYKTLFCDAMQGFAEFAKLKGYGISTAIDTSVPEKVGVKFVIADAGITVSTAKVKRDVDEYINKLKTSDNLRDMPIVTDPIEHERLISAITMRFSYLKHEAELHALQSSAYQRMFETVRSMTERGISYAPPPQNLNIQVYNRGDSNMVGDSYKAEHSPGASVGIGNIAHIEGSSIIVGSSNEQRTQQAASIDALIQLVRTSMLADPQKATAIRHLENVQEEIASSDKPDSGLIAKSFERLTSLFTVAAVGAELYEKAKSVFALFGVSI